MGGDPLVARAIVLTRTIGRELHQSGGDLWLQLDLTLPQLRCLLLIHERAPITIGGIGRQLGIGLPSASAHVDRLVEQELVHRREDPQDRRRTLTTVTGPGAALVERLRQGSLHTLRDWLDALPSDDLAALVRGMEAVVRGAGLSECPVPALETSPPVTMES